MKKAVAFCLFSLLIKANAQPDKLNSIFAKSEGLTVETVYLHCNRYSVVSGDSIWWTAYILQNGSLLSAISKTLYVELFAGDGSQPIAEKLFPIVNGLSIGQLGVPDTLRSGEYWLRAYTRYQLNFDSTHLFQLPILVSRKNESTAFETKIRKRDPDEPIVTENDKLLLITTKTDSGLVWHLDADPGCLLFDKRLDLVLAAYHRPILKASFILQPNRPWRDLAFNLKDQQGILDLLLFSGDSLICRQTVDLGYPNPEVISVIPDTLSDQPGGYNVWSVEIRGVQIYNCSLSVTDADRSSAQPVMILQDLTPDPFNYQAATKGEIPEIRWEDSAYLDLKGTIRMTNGMKMKSGELITLLSKDSSAGKPLLVPVDGNGRFHLSNEFFFDSAWLSYELNSIEGDMNTKKLQISFDHFDRPCFRLSLGPLWKDITVKLPAPIAIIPDTSVLSILRIKELPQVIVNADPRKELDNRYATGIFSEPTPYSFDLRTDKTANSIWEYLRKNLPGFQGGLDIAEMPALDGKSVIFYVDDRVQSLDDMRNFWYEEIAYIKGYSRLWVDDTRFMRQKSGYKGFFLKGDFIRIPAQSDPPVICLYTRKGIDVQSALPGMNKIRIGGYSPIAKWTASALDPLTLYWNPLENSNNFKVRFFNTGVKKFRIRIEGISTHGQRVHYEQIIAPDTQESQTVLGQR